MEDRPSDRIAVSLVSAVSDEGDIMAFHDNEFGSLGNKAEDQ